MKDKHLQAIEKLDRMIEAYQAKIKQFPNNEPLIKAFNDLIFIKDVLWDEGKEETHFYKR